MRATKSVLVEWIILIGASIIGCDNTDKNIIPQHQKIDETALPSATSEMLTSTPLLGEDKYHGFPLNVMSIIAVAPGCGMVPEPNIPPLICPAETIFEIKFLARRSCYSKEDFKVEILPQGVQILRIPRPECYGSYGETDTISLKIENEIYSENDPVQIKTILNPPLVIFTARP